MKFLPFLLLGFLLLPFTVQAGIVPSPDLKCENLQNIGPKTVEFCNILQTIADIMTVCAAVIALIAILLGGITIMTAGGSEDKLNKGKKILLYGLIGAAVVYASTFILGLLNEILPG